MTALMKFSQLRLTEPGKFTNPRKTSGLDPDAIRSLAIHIGLHGLLNPPLITRDGLVIAGSRRCHAVAWLILWFHPATDQADHGPAGDATLKAINDLTLEERRTLEERAIELSIGMPVRVIGGAGLEGVALAENLQREDLSSFEITFHLNHLRAQGATGAELARMIGKSDTYVSRKLGAFTNAGPELKLAWERGTLTDEQVYHLAEFTHEKQAKALAGEIPKRGAANRPPIDAVKDILGELERRRPPAGVQLAVGEELRSASYAAGVRDALRWVTGNKKTSEDFAKLVESATS